MSKATQNGRKPKRRRKNICHLKYQYSDGVVDYLGTLGLREEIWHIRYWREGKEVEESSESCDRTKAALILLAKWREEGLKMDAHSVLQTHKRLSALQDPEVRRLVSHGRFAATIDSDTRQSHRRLGKAIAPLDWWEGPGQNLLPPLGFGCRCRLIGISRADAMRRIGRGDGSDLTVLSLDDDVIDPLWRRWKMTLIHAWDEARHEDVNPEEAKLCALAAACSVLEPIRELDIAALRFVD